MFFRGYMAPVRFYVGFISFEPRKTLTMNDN